MCWTDRPLIGLTHRLWLTGSRTLHSAHIGIIVDVDMVTEGGVAGSVELDKDNLLKVAGKEDLLAMGVKVWMALVLLGSSWAIQ